MKKCGRVTIPGKFCFAPEQTLSLPLGHRVQDAFFLERFKGLESGVEPETPPGKRIIDL
jgi:hypothetical protein